MTDTPSDEVERVIAYLARLNDKAFAEAMADNADEPDESITQALLSPQIAPRCLAHVKSLSDDHYRECLADNIMDPSEPYTQAFRSTELVARSEAACEFLIRTQASHVREKLVGDTEDMRQRRAKTSYFISKVVFERRLLQTILNESEARRGLQGSKSNPRARAMKRLAQLNLAGDVPQGMYRTLLEEEEEKDRARRAEQRKAAKQRAAAAKKKAAQERARERSTSGIRTFR